MSSLRMGNKTHEPEVKLKDLGEDRAFLNKAVQDAQHLSPQIGRGYFSR